MYQNRNLKFQKMSKVKSRHSTNDLCKDKETNLQKAIEKVREAAAKGAQIVCLQKNFLRHFIFVM